MPPPILGIIIEPHLEREGRIINFDTYVGYWKPGILFIKTPAIQEAIRREEYEEGRGIGHFRYEINPKKKVCVSISFYPQGYGMEKSKLFGVGITSLCDIRIQRFLESKYPGYRIRGTLDPKEKRRDYLEKRGFAVGKPIPIRESINRLKKYTITKFQSRIKANLAQRRRS